MSEKPVGKSGGYDEQNIVEQLSTKTIVDAKQYCFPHFFIANKFLGTNDAMTLYLGQRKLQRGSVGDDRRTDKSGGGG